MKKTAINFQQKLSLFSEHWSPKIIAQLNDYDLKLVRIKGDFVWHDHEDTDEVFIVIEGKMQVQFRDKQVELEEGEMIVVPRGEEHKPYAENECKLLVIEPSGTRNTGEQINDRTAENGVWI
jgi:mannose-6-phosphate isomerase-like protein (cupin superfamily)